MGKRILIVDDELDMLVLMKACLSRITNGHEVDTACSGEEALDKMDGQSFDLVITDLRMPGIDGLQLIEQVQNRYPGTKFVLVTACGSADVEAQATRLGLLGYFTKPFVRQRMLATVQAALA
jgi:DNA-binding NtrC family response regulator